MLNLLSGDDRRGIVILTAKDYRTLSNNLFHYKVFLSCINSNLNILERFHMAEDDENGKNNIEYIKFYIDEAKKHIDKAQDVLR